MALEVEGVARTLEEDSPDRAHIRTAVVAALEEGNPSEVAASVFRVGNQGIHDTSYCVYCFKDL
ncbi:hypothetical protein P3T76_004848 [Phytophthora citrophthora]|uniref:Uncharacterized protein n=1 Tax=Phytophthora citrophthora TaxID=4793 RepID=A0AAD9GRM8_9STRA|nr:hypothetical protein P3T76_004848 [Phytophthora citrophthora]